MNKTNAQTTNLEVLERRILVSDIELAEMLGVGLSTARRIADESNAVCRFGKLKRNNVAIIKQHLAEVAE